MTGLKYMLLPRSENDLDLGQEGSMVFIAWNHCNGTMWGLGFVLNLFSLETSRKILF